jgi:hypothetical protein
MLACSAGEPLLRVCHRKAAVFGRLNVSQFEQSRNFAAKNNNFRAEKGYRRSAFSISAEAFFRESIRRRPFEDNFRLAV